MAVLSNQFLLFIETALMV